MRQISIVNSLHIKLADELEKDIISYTSRRLGDETSFTKDELCRIIFANYRIVDGVPHGIRLTPFGNNMMAKKYSNYHYKHDSKINNKTYIALDNIMKWPYYLSRKSVTFYSEDDAAWFRLNGNDINSYVDII